MRLLCVILCPEMCRESDHHQGALGEMKRVLRWRVPSLQKQAFNATREPSEWMNSHILSPSLALTPHLRFNPPSCVLLVGQLFHIPGPAMTITASHILRDSPLDAYFQCVLVVFRLLGRR